MHSDNETTVKELALLIRSEFGYWISFRTVLKGRKLLGWTSRGAANCQLIQQQNKEKRLRWARENLHDDFTDVVWSDETHNATRNTQEILLQEKRQGSEAPL